MRNVQRKEKSVKYAVLFNLSIRFLCLENYFSHSCLNAFEWCYVLLHTYSCHVNAITVLE